MNRLTLVGNAGNPPLQGKDSRSCLSEWSHMWQKEWYRGYCIRFIVY